jgi:hypothetical protein
MSFVGPVDYIVVMVSMFRPYGAQAGKSRAANYTEFQ